MQEEEKIQESVLTVFQEMSRIPRKSGHEERISVYLLEKIKGMNLAVEQDAYGNIIAEKPAAPGYEDYPCTILQAHMDMVCVAAEGRTYDPLLDPIELRRENGYLCAEGTSLGADDGIGVAAIVHLLQEKFSHGPLRAIFTVDEEDGMTGAKNLAKKYLDGHYLINCDSEDIDLLTVSSAGSVNLDFHRELHWVAPRQATAVCLSVKGLLGGHSGMEINCGHANAIRILGLILDRLNAAGVEFELGKVCGGTARNAIPANASAVIVVAAKEMSLVDQVIENTKIQFKSVYGGVEKTAIIERQDIDFPALVMDAKTKKGLIILLCLLHTGVYAMSPSIPGLVQSSANLGVVETGENGISIQFFPRSAANEIIESFKSAAGHFARASEFELSVGAQSSAWPVNLTSKLAPIIREVFEDLSGKPMKMESIHAGLECSWFYLKNPALDMVSIGPTLTHVHSPKERLHLNTLALHVKVIQETLKRLK